MDSTILTSCDKKDSLLSPPILDLKFGLPYDDLKNLKKPNCFCMNNVNEILKNKNLRIEYLKLLLEQEKNKNKKSRNGIKKQKKTKSKRKKRNKVTKRARIIELLGDTDLMKKYNIEETNKKPFVQLGFKFGDVVDLLKETNVQISKQEIGCHLSKLFKEEVIKRVGKRKSYVYFQTNVMDTC